MRQWTCRWRGAAAGTNTKDREPHQKLAEKMPQVLPVSPNPAGGLVFGSWPPELRANACCTLGHLVGGGDSRWRPGKLILLPILSSFCCFLPSPLFSLLLPLLSPSPLHLSVSLALDLQEV